MRQVGVTLPRIFIANEISASNNNETSAFVPFDPFIDSLRENFSCKLSILKLLEIFVQISHLNLSFTNKFVKVNREEFCEIAECSRTKLFKDFIRNIKQRRDMGRRPTDRLQNNLMRLDCPTGIGERHCQSAVKFRGRQIVLCEGQVKVVHYPLPSRLIYSHGTSIFFATPVSMLVAK